MEKRRQADGSPARQPDPHAEKLIRSTLATVLYIRTLYKVTWTVVIVELEEILASLSKLRRQHCKKVDFLKVNSLLIPTSRMGLVSNALNIFPFIFVADFSSLMIK